MPINRLRNAVNSVIPNKRYASYGLSSKPQDLFFPSQSYNKCSKIIDQKNNSQGIGGWNYYANYYLMDNGRQIWACGNNTYLMAGSFARDSHTIRPMPCQLVEPLDVDDRIIDFAQGYGYCVFITQKGYVYSGGLNQQGNLGLNDTNTWPHFKRVDTGSLTFGPGGTEKPVRVYTNSGQDMTGLKTTFVLTDKGNLYGTGYNGTYNLGLNGDATNKQVFVRAAPNITGIKEFYPGVYTCGAILNDGTLYTWGQNGDGQQGLNNTNAQQFPVISAYNVSKLIHCWNQYDYRYAFHIKTDGTVWFTGYNDNSSQGSFSGLGDNTGRIIWTQVTTNLSGKNVVDIKIGGYTGTTTRYGTTWFLIDDGTIYATGYNGYGQIGDGTTTHRSTPTLLIRPSGFPKVDRIIVYGNWAQTGLLAINTESQRMFGVGCWHYGILGYGFGNQGGISPTWPNQTSTTWRAHYPAREVDMPPPVQDGYAKFIDYAVLATESSSQMALIFLLDDGTVWTKGYDYYRMLGTGDFIWRSTAAGYSGYSYYYGEHHNFGWRQVKF